MRTVTIETIDRGGYGTEWQRIKLECQLENNILKYITIVDIIEPEWLFEGTNKETLKHIDILTNHTSLNYLKEFLKYYKQLKENDCLKIE